MTHRVTFLLDAHDAARYLTQQSDNALRQGGTLMETLSTRIKRSGKEFGDHGHQFLMDTKQAGQSFMSFVQGEAKDWGEYLRTRYRHLEEQGKGMLHPENPRETVWAHLDGLIGKVTRRDASNGSGAKTASSEETDTADEVEMVDETSEYEEVDETDLEEGTE